MLISTKMSPYFSLQSALMNAFSDNNYAFIILDGYIMALIKYLDCIYVFDSHAHNCCGMPDVNGTALVMKYDDVSKLEQFLSLLSLELNSDFLNLYHWTFALTEKS